MTGRGDHRDARPFDPNATVALPVVGHEPGAGVYDPNATVVMPVVPPAGPGAHGPGAHGPGAHGPGATRPTPAGAGPVPPEAVSPTQAPSEAPTEVLPVAGAGPGDEGTGSVGRNSAIMAAGSLVSRVTGLLRNSVLVAAVGSAVVGNAYTVGNTLPNMVYELLLGGVLSSVVIPMLVRARTHDPDRGEAYAQRLLTLATILLGAATVLAVACAPLLSHLFQSHDASVEGEHLRTVLTYLLLPEIFFYGLAALTGAVLNTRGHFAAPMWTPILNNIVVIVACGAYILLPSPHDRTQGPLTTAQVLVLGVGTTLGIVAQAAGLFPPLRKVGFRWRWRFDFRALHLGELGRVSAWMLGYVVVSQIGVFVLLIFAQRAFDRGGLGPITYNNAYLVFAMAHGIVAVSIMTALMPRMSAAAAEGRFRDVAGELSLGTRLSSVILIPATAAYVALGQPLAVVLFGYGANKGHMADTGTVIALAGLGLVPFAISQLQLFAFYAMPDTRTPALINVPVVAVRLLVDLVLYLVLPVILVVAGLMFGNAVSYLVAVVIGYWLLRRRVGRLGLRSVGSALARLALAAAVAAVPAWLIAVALRHTLGTGWTSSVLQLVLGGVVLLALYAGLALVLRVREVREFAATIGRRFGR